jgi:drug/metabolite transporter (DMT)-like permease
LQSGVFLILLSMSLTPFGDALSKHLGESQSPFFIVFLRYFVAGLIALVFAGVTSTPVEIPKAGRVGLILRTALVMGAMTLLIVALAMIPLANAVGGFLIAPIVATIISVVLYGENLTLARITGAGLSVVGAILILKPGAGIDAGTLFALLGGALLGSFLALSRNAPTGQNPISVLAVQCLLGSTMILPLALFHFDQFSMALILPALGLGFIAAATHFLTVRAYQYAEASQLAPFFYFNLVAAVVVGFLWFGEVPDWITALGLLLIVLGGLVSLSRMKVSQNLLGSNINSLPRFRPELHKIYSNNR